MGNMNDKQKSSIRSALYLIAAFGFLMYAGTLKTVWLIVAIIFLVVAIIWQKVFPVQNPYKQLDKPEKIDSAADSTKPDGDSK